jgi:hypothetical protein
MWHLKRSIFGFRTQPALVSKIRRPNYRELRETSPDRLNSNNSSMRGIPCLFVWCGMPGNGGNGSLDCPLGEQGNNDTPSAAGSHTDGAGWHTDDIAQRIDNLSIIKLPPYSPELDPIEQVWRWLRQMS